MKKIVMLSLLTAFLFFNRQVEGQSSQQVIDMHVHVYSEKSFGASSDYANDGVFLKGSASWKDHLKEVVEKMQKNNVVLAYASGDFEILDFLNKNYPDQFFPSIEIWPTKDTLADPNFLAELRKKLETKEIRGIGEVLNFYTGLAPNDPVMDTIYKIAEDNDIPVCMHFAPGPPGVQTWGGFFSLARYRYSNPLLLEDVLVKYPKLRVSIMHAGTPAFTEETFAMFGMFPNVYADIGFLPEMSNYTRASLKEFLKKAVEYGFTDRIMFGSDEMRWPSVIDIGIKYIMNTDFLTQKQKEDILYNNAAKFLRLSTKTEK